MRHIANKRYLIIAAQIPIQLNFIDFAFWTTKRIKPKLVKNEEYMLSIKK